MCRYTSIFLKVVLNNSTDRSWRLVAGRPVTREDEGTERGCFGFRTTNGLFFDHCWLQSVDRIVDITADQFGAEPVIITAVQDPRYYPNLAESDLEQDLAKLAHRPEKWLQQWYQQDEQISEGYTDKSEYLLRKSIVSSRSN